MKIGDEQMKKSRKSATVLFAVAIAAWAACAPAADLIHNWTFDSDLTDAVGSKDATGFNGANFQTTTSKIGAGSALFDGGNDYMTAGTSGDFVIGTGAMSVSFWFKITTAAASDRFLATGAGNNTMEGWTVFLDTTSPDRVCPGMSDGGGRRIQKGNANGASDAGDGGWHLAVAVFDHNGGNGTVDIYVDSVKETTLGLDDLGSWNGSSIDNTYALTFGKLPEGSSNYLDGYLDDVAIWNGALSQAEIDALWNGGTGSPAATGPSATPGTLIYGK